MFGNLIGWIVSVVLMVLAGLLGQKVWQESRPTPQSGWVDAKLQPLSLDDAVKGLLPAADNMKDDAGDLYRQAAADYERNKPVYDLLLTARDLKEVDYESIIGLQNLLKAATCQSMDLFKSRPEEVVGFDTDILVLDRLQSVADAVGQLAAIAKADKKYDLSRKYAVALEVLGYHLYKERAAYDELGKGESILGTANTLLISLDQAQAMPDKAAAHKQFETARRAEAEAKIDPVHKVMSSIGPQNISEHSGDFYQMAADPAVDHVWRVEAIRRIGRLHFNAEHAADQHKSLKFLAKLAGESDDSLIKAAAIRALNMTEKDNQCLR